MEDWLFLQLADSAFPTGGFSHSGGLEANVQLGGVARGRLAAFLEAQLRQAGHAQLPFALAAHDGAAGVDDACDAFLSSHVANAASRTQGRAFVATCARVFERAPIVRLYDDVRARRTAGHLAPSFGACLAALGVGRARTARLFLFGALRGGASAAVRLGLVGTHEAQRAQHALAPLLEEVASACAALAVDDAAQTAPLIELFGAMHDTLDARMFQS